MRTSGRLTVTLLVLGLALTVAFAQKGEIAVTVGGNFPRSSGFGASNSFAAGANFAGRTLHVPLASLYAEIPVVFAMRSVQQVTLRSGYSAVFLTPGLRLKIAPGFPVSPYVAFGGGWARYTGESGNANGRVDNKAVWDWAAGTDLKVLPYFSVRGEVRDFHAGKPRFTPVSGSQHDLTVQTGLVFRF